MLSIDFLGRNGGKTRYEAQQKIKKRSPNFTTWSTASLKTRSSAPKHHSSFARWVGLEMFLIPPKKILDKGIDFVPLSLCLLFKELLSSPWVNFDYLRAYRSLSLHHNSIQFMHYCLLRITLRMKVCVCVLKFFTYCFLAI